MNIVEVRNIKIGDGMPKICVPIVGVTKQDIIEEAKTFKDIPVDVVEWRVDWFEDVFEFEKVKEVLRELRDVLLETPVLFTFRTSKEGGEKEIETDTYASLIKNAAASGLVDLVDIEVFTGDEIVKEIIEESHKYGVKVITSNHDFHKTPAKDEIISRLCKMQDLGADIPKIALMPENKKDVLTVLEATAEMIDKHAKQPIITMSMGGVGVVSRLAGEVFGSALTFGAAKKASAPGQIGVQELQTVLKIMHKSI